MLDSSLSQAGDCNRGWESEARRRGLGIGGPAGEGRLGDGSRGTNRQAPQPEAGNRAMANTMMSGGH